MIFGKAKQGSNEVKISEKGGGEQIWARRFYFVVAMRLRDDHDPIAIVEGCGRAFENGIVVIHFCG